MNFFKLFLITSFTLFLTACGGGGSSDSEKSSETSGVSSEKITFDEKQNGNLEIIWDKVGNTYKVLAVEKNASKAKKSAEKTFDRIKIYETKQAGHIIIVCRPDNLGDSTVTYQCATKHDGVLKDPASFVVYLSDGRQDFVLGTGSSFETASYQFVEEKLSTTGLDIDMKYGEYKLLDTERTSSEYHGYFLLLENEKAKGREYSNGEKISPDYDFAWNYNRNTKRIVLDNRPVGGGYAEGTVYGNSDNIHVDGTWNTGATLSASLIYMSDSKVFTRDNKVIALPIENYDASSINHF